MATAASDPTANISDNELLENSAKLREYLAEGIINFNRILKDDRDFCTKDIEATYDVAKKHVDTIVELFHKRLEELKIQLDETANENEKTCDQNKEQFDSETMEISNLFTEGNNYEALAKYKNLESRFDQRPTMIEYVPRLRLNELDINRYLSFGSLEKKSKFPPPTTTAPVLSNDQDNDVFLLDDNKQTHKEEERNKKVIENDVINGDDGLTDEIDHNVTEREIDKSRFGILSRKVENQPTIPPTTISNRISAAIPSALPTSIPRFFISTRLLPSTASSHQPIFQRDRNNSSPSGQNSSHINNGPTRPTPTPPHSVCSSINFPSTTVKSTKSDGPDLKLVAHFQYTRNTSVLMACSSKIIVIFQTPTGRMDNWKLGAIERGADNEFELDWHDGLILSMGYIERNFIYMFTERDFIRYSLDKRKKTDTRHLPRGNDDDPDSTVLLYDGLTRGIGTVFGKHIYHIYQNRNNHWTLSKILLEKYVKLFDYDLTQILPNVQRFLHICVNDFAISFLVQTNDSTYAVVFCSINNCIPLKTNPLVRACRPLTICSAFVDSFQQYIWFVNDPTANLIHCLNNERYLKPIFQVAHAIGYVQETKELIITLNKGFHSINVNECQF